MQSGLFYLIYRQRYLRRWSPEMFAGRVVTLAALPAGNGDETESEGQQNVSHEISVLTASSRRFELINKTRHFSTFPGFIFLSL